MDSYGADSNRLTVPPGAPTRDVEPSLSLILLGIRRLRAGLVPACHSNEQRGESVISLRQA
jgi:hypothetical protein